MSQREHGAAEVLSRLFRHNTWANLTLLDYCERLDDQQLDDKPATGYGSIRATLLHFLDSEVDYVNLATGKIPEAPFQEGVVPAFAGLRAAAQWAGIEMLELADQTSAGAVVRTARAGEPRYAFPLAGLLVQLLDHSAWHRAQIDMAIRRLGLTPPSLSGWKHMRELGEFLEVPEAAGGAS